MRNSIKSAIRRFLRPPLHQPTVKLPYTFIGSVYGGWPLLNETSRGSLIFSFGVGEDISFDLGSIDKHSCQVHAFDPTPRSQKWVSEQRLPAEFCFHPEGLAGKNGIAEFAPPTNDEFASFHSTRGMDATVSGAITRRVRTIQSWIEDLNIGRPDVIKMDIEGFEFEVIDDMISSRCYPSQLLVEFHHGMYGFSDGDTRRAVERLLSAGFELYCVASSGREYAFYHPSEWSQV